MLTMRMAETGDATMICTVYNAAIQLPFASADRMEKSAEYFEAMLRSRDLSVTPFFVATADEQIVGWAVLNLYRHGRLAVRPTREISYFVHPEHHRQGIGSALVSHCLAVCPQLGVTNLMTYVIDKNKASVGLLRKFKFEEWGRLPRIVKMDDVVTDHVILGRHL